MRAGLVRWAPALLLLAACWGSLGLRSTGHTPVYRYKVIHTYPHDPAAFTQGLIYLDGYLYESTGLEGRSSVRMDELETGRVIRKQDVALPYFAEGLTNWKGRLIQLTWQTGVAFAYDLFSFKREQEFHYPGEGWGLTQDGKRMFESDGSSDIRFWNPDTLAETGRIHVRDEGQPVDNLNELEYIKGEIYANIWQTDRIARISPTTGKVLGWIDLTGLLPASERSTPDAVLNGIAYDAAHGRLFVTGKLWPKLFEIELVPQR